MKKKDKATSALLAVFPSHELFTEFADDKGNSRTLESMIEYADRTGICEGRSRKALEAFIRSNARSPEDRTVPSGLNFETVLDKKNDLLRLSMSVRGLTDRINSLIKESRIDLPMVSNSMLTRLKKEPVDTDHKQNVLRSFAFWLGHERSEAGRMWNYESLLKLCNSAKPQEHHREGVRIGFALYGRGEVIDHEIVGWLRKAIRTYTERPVEFVPGRWGALEAQNVCVYSFTRTYGEMMPAAEYALQMEKSIRMIESRAGKNLSRKDDQYVIEPDPKFSSLLMTLNF